MTLTKTRSTVPPDLDELAEATIGMCLNRIHPVHVAQAVSYLRATNLRLALVVNFNVEFLKRGIRRVVL